MDKIRHNFIIVQGLKLHLAELGSGLNVVLFLHGFPEIWYSWRHQMVAVADAGFRAVAPDYKRLRTFGPSTGTREGNIFRFG
ncbi:hypothetical protein SLEP1_g52885 [Rubroshorea leprosula]|uniref:AB hydrolase-1 domain-containing protein n=1 Tax=Rubroshorea leprosula TaxID=152421 RepID=A0AAV5M7N7_9ROSI|nr:hypothetical protein SLEP1_g52885 [Rubroshorea leprosula]